VTAVTCDARRTVAAERQLPRQLRVIRGMAYCLLLRYDSDGPCPVLVSDDERLDCNGARARYCFVASTETWAEANAIMEWCTRRSRLGSSKSSREPSSA